MLRATEILCATLLVIGSLVVDAQISGVSSNPSANDLILSRLDLARLSQLRVELRKLEPVRRCAVLQQELTEMFGGSVATGGPDGVFGVVASALAQRQQRFQNNQPVSKEIQMCIDLAKSDSPSSSQNLPVQKEVISIPTTTKPVQVPLMNTSPNPTSQLDAITSRPTDVAEDLFKTWSMNYFSEVFGNPAMHQGSQYINSNVDTKKNRDIVDEDGRCEDCKSMWLKLIEQATDV